MAEFRVTLKCMWDKSGGKFKKFESKPSKKLNQSEENFSLRMEAVEDMEPEEDEAQSNEDEMDEDEDEDRD